MQTKQEQFIDAVEKGRIESFDKLLNDPEVDPSANNHSIVLEALYRAYTYCKEYNYELERDLPLVNTWQRTAYLHIAESLLKDPRIDTSKVKELLLQHQAYAEARAYVEDPSADEQSHHAVARMMKLAVEQDRIEVLKLILADPWLKPDFYSGITERAVECGRVEIVKLLLADPKVNPAGVKQLAIVLASKNGYVETVKLLLADALKKNQHGGNIDVTGMVMQIPEEMQRQILGVGPMDKIDNVTQELIFKIVQEQDAILDMAQKRVDYSADIAFAKQLTMNTPPHPYSNAIMAGVAAGHDLPPHITTQIAIEAGLYGPYHGANSRQWATHALQGEAMNLTALNSPSRVVRWMEAPSKRNELRVEMYKKRVPNIEQHEEADEVVKETIDLVTNHKGITDPDPVITRVLKDIYRNPSQSDSNAVVCRNILGGDIKCTMTWKEKLGNIVQGELKKAKAVAPQAGKNR